MSLHNLSENAVIGTSATFVVTLAGAEDFGLKLCSSLLVAVLSTLAVHLVKRLLKWRE